MQTPVGFYMMLVIYGPTVTGKTALAFKIAKKINGEIISADSRQVFTGLDIGTGKVSLDSIIEKHKGFWIVNGIKVSGFDIASPGETFSAADFIKYASDTLIRIIGMHKVPIVVGGTGFYIKALLHGIESAGVPPDKSLRKKLEKLSKEKLYQKLLAINPQKAESMNQSDRQNPRRLIRAIEVSLHPSTKTVNSEQLTSNYILIGLTAPNEFLYLKADSWLDRRLKNGLVEEVELLLKNGVDPKWLDDLGLEYRWIKRYLFDKISYEEAVRRLKGNIHSFIRRQKTFFNQFKSTDIWDVSQKNWQSRLENKIEKLLGRE